ncbi:hypothetical protein BM523_16095 [Alteromonas mediterranea]|uniref:hypothetical protein n=1 Tax=Alteromonas mediterranea TaxID=314275 RepID=UPI000903831F|nr:hypothetical protein [Alteromonas mediterranea]APD95390.1 hypothetical protein BM523_16095 [Alteromonas mediterranea]APD99024.1 hypothetical protein BM525_16115 [Alteromonas mediterranea]
MNINSELEKENELLLSQLQEMSRFMDLMSEDYEKALNNNLREQVCINCSGATRSKELLKSEHDKELESKCKELDSQREISEKALRLNNVASKYISNVFSSSLFLKRLIKRQKKAILSSGFFDESWYRTEYLPQDTNESPIEHYLVEGWLTGNDPSAEFSTIKYLIANPDVAEAGLNPLYHYVKYGLVECRNKD